MQGRNSIMGRAQPVEGTKPDAATKGFRLWRSLRVGCLLVIIGLCAGVGALVMALQSGPVELKMPGESFLKIGSDDFVMSNYSFQNGTTYYLDVDGNGVR